MAFSTLLKSTFPAPLRSPCTTTGRRSRRLQCRPCAWGSGYPPALPFSPRARRACCCGRQRQCRRQALSKRIHYGKFVAEAKFQELPETYEPAIRAQDEDKLTEMLTYPKVEEKVTRRVKTKAQITGQEVNPDAADTVVPKIQPEVAAELYDKWVMPLTKQVQVQYLLKRLD